ncbi:hypothetical protein QZH41_000533 [Actinostola sp. cb2023]|nr:hypothetical protein QZH41_000533 [Actinostola sp. cb2023]
MWSTDGGEKDPVRLFKLWLSKRPYGMKDNGPLYLGIIQHTKTSDVWYSKIRMGENTIGKIDKTMAACLTTDKKITNHSMRKTLVSKLKKAGHPRHIIKEITAHARESSLDDNDEIDEFQKRIISCHKWISSSKIQYEYRAAKNAITANLTEYPPSGSQYQYFTELFYSEFFSTL